MNPTVADSATWRIAGVARIQTPLNTLEALTLLYVILTALIFAGTVVALYFTARNLGAVAAARRDQLRGFFEGTFFRLLELRQEVVDSTWVVVTSLKPLRPRPTGFFDRQYEDVESRIEGVAAMVEMRENLRTRYNGRKQGKPDESEGERLRWVWEDFWHVFETRLGHYFRTLYHIVRFVDEAPVERRQLYVSLVRAQLSSGELFLLFYDCAVGPGNPKFRALIERYGLLESLDRADLLDETHIGLYGESAYKESVGG